MKVLTKRNNLLSVCKSIKYLDPFFFELLIDSISDSNKTLLLKKKPQTLFIVYLNIFATKNLNIPVLQIDKVKTNLNLRRSIRTFEIKDQQLLSQIEKNLFYKFYLSRDNKLLTSRIRSYKKIIKSWDKI